MKNTNEIYSSLISALSDIETLLNSKEKGLSNLLQDKFFGCKKDGVIGVVNFIEIITKTVSWYNGLTLQIAINYQPRYLFGIAKDAQEVLRIDLERVKDYVFLDDLKSLELLLEVAD